MAGDQNRRQWSSLPILTAGQLPSGQSHRDCPKKKQSQEIRKTSVAGVGNENNRRMAEEKSYCEVVFGIPFLNMLQKEFLGSLGPLYYQTTLNS